MSRLEQPTLLQVPVNPSEVARKLSWASAIEHCAELAGYSLDKQSSAIAGMDKARWSRIKSGQEGIKPDQLEAFMDACGNDAPLLWLMHRRGWDLNSVRKRETETERALRLAEKRIAELERDKRVLAEAIRGNV
ncbi:hypothetical protein [Lysobacter capsici]|uniref:hypothetical protein n=1 Tax=Lysobacter capsici TaxID=435897 RepID=UPI001C0084D0|nr:hypothetical protein [Lysobacter capsici]QWF19276.1 hypothetical protein KME82_11315 [Lysobacter capsici]